MNIGIAAPIEVRSLKDYVNNPTDFELSLGLGGTAVNLIIKGLLKYGHKVTVFSLDPKVEDKVVIQGESLKIAFGHFRQSTKVKMLDFCRIERLAIERLIKEEGQETEIINAHWSYEFSIGTIRSKKKHLITFRDDSFTILKITRHPYRISRLFMDLWVRKHGKAFSYNSPYLKNKITLEGVIIPNPIELKEKVLSRSISQNQKINIVFVANGWDKRKNPMVAIQAFKTLNNNRQNTCLHLIGKGFDDEALQRDEVKTMGLPKDVYFHGYMSYVDLLNFMQGMDIMLHTSIEESFGNNLVEAMALGIPVVAGKDSGAVPWVLNEGEAGVLCDITNPEEVSMALEQIISDSNFYQKLSCKSIENVRNRFSLDVVTQQYLERYHQILL